MSVPKKQDGWRPGTAQDLETMYHFKERFRELKKLLDLVESGKLDMKAFFTDSGNANFRNGLQYSGSPTKPLYMAVWDADDSADGTQPNRRVRSIEAEDARKLIGAAPDKYVATYTITSASLSLDALIEQQYALTADRGMRHFMFNNTVSNAIAGSIWAVTIYRYNASHGRVELRHIYQGQKHEMHRFISSGSWGEWEWVNPPMVAGSEYRTTERWNGKPVYKKLIEYTNPVAISGAMSLDVPHGIANLDMMLTANCTTSKYLLPYVTAGSSLSISAWNSTNLTMYGNSSWGAGRKWYIEMRYTKTL